MRILGTIRKLIGLVAVALLLAVQTGFGQARKTVMVGRVTNRVTGQPIPKALVIQRNLQTKVQSHRFTNERGTYAFEGLTPGRYSISADAPPGFESEEKSPVFLGSTSPQEVDFALKPVGSVAPAPITCQGPLREPDVLTLLRGRVSDERISQFVKTCTSNLEWNTGLEERLRSAGASDFVLDLFRPRTATGAWPVPMTSLPSVDLGPGGDPQFWAVVVGISRFANLLKEEWLEFADADATAFAKFLRSPRGRGFPAENVRLLTNESASVAAIKKALASDLPRRVRSDDTVYLFFATHGMTEKEGARASYLLAHDSDREDLYNSALVMHELMTIIQTRLKAKRILLFLDACRAGKLGQAQGDIFGYMGRPTRRGDFLGLLASRPNESSREGRQFGGGHGAFTYFLLRGLMGEGDRDKDKIVTAAELVGYLQDMVRTATDKHQNVRDFGEYDTNTPLAFVDKPGPADLRF